MWDCHRLCFAPRDVLMKETSVKIPGSPSSTLEGWLHYVRTQVDETLGQVLKASGGPPRDARWAHALDKTEEYVVRPGKRLRPALLMLGYGMVSGEAEFPPALLSFAAAVELLHTFMLVHDDIADGAETRRGGPALHRVFGLDKRSEDLAVVLGDYLFARAIEVMLSSGLPRASLAAQYYLGTCRKAAIGQYLDFNLDDVRLSTVNLFEVLRVAKLKTAEPSFVAPLAAGGLLAGASSLVMEALARVGQHMGVAFQLRDDLLGLFGEPRVTGKPCDCDLIQGKRTFPVLAAYLRAPRAVRGEMDELWSRNGTQEDALDRARHIVCAYGGLAATERAIDRASRIARGALQSFPQDNPFRRLLNELIQVLTRRDS
jgi:geranylgeranyl diphosphate synthase type I